MSRLFPRTRAASAAVTVIAGLLFAAAPASAAAPACAPETLSQPFAAWGDTAHYFLAPDGRFDAGAEGWSLMGGAAVETDADPRANGSSLVLPPGSSATSTPMCVDIDYPTMRFFARNTGAPDARLAVSIRFRLSDGGWRSLRLADLTAGDTLEPTRAVWLLANYLSVSSAWDHQVSLRFAPVGDGGHWAIDDVHVDPYAR